MTRRAPVRLLLLALALGACGRSTPHGVCAAYADAAAACGTGTSYTYTRDELEDCETSLDTCSKEDLALLEEYVECFAQACAPIACESALEELAPGCPAT